MPNYIQYTTRTVTPSDAKKRATYVDAGWDFDETWNILEDVSFPFFKAVGHPDDPDGDGIPDTIEVTAYYRAIEEIAPDAAQYDHEFNGKRYRKFGDSGWAKVTKSATLGEEFTFNAGEINRKVAGTRDNFGFVFSTVRGNSTNETSRKIVAKGGNLANNSVFFYFVRDVIADEPVDYVPPVETTVRMQQVALVPSNEGNPNNVYYDGNEYRATFKTPFQGYKTVARGFPGDFVTVKTPKMSYYLGTDGYAGTYRDYGFLFSSVRGEATKAASRVLDIRPAQAYKNRHNEDNTVHFYYLINHDVSEEDRDTDGDGIPDNIDPDIDGDGIPNEEDDDPTGDNGGNAPGDGGGIPPWVPGEPLPPGHPLFPPDAPNQDEPLLPDDPYYPYPPIYPEDPNYPFDPDDPNNPGVPIYPDDPNYPFDPETPSKVKAKAKIYLLTKGYFGGYRTMVNVGGSPAKTQVYTLYEEIALEEFEGLPGETFSATVPYKETFTEFRASGTGTRYFEYFGSSANGETLRGDFGTDIGATREIVLSADSDNEIIFFFDNSYIRVDEDDPDSPEIPIDDDGSATLPDGTIVDPDDTVTEPDGTVTDPGGVTTEPDGTIIVPPEPVWPEDNPYMPPVGGEGPMSPYQPPTPGRAPTEVVIHIMDKQTDSLIDFIPQNEFWDDVRKQELATNWDTFDFSTFATRSYSGPLENRNRILIPDKRTNRFAEFIIEEATQIRDSDGSHYKAVGTSASYVELRKQRFVPPQEVAGLTPREHLEYILVGTEWSPGIIDDGPTVSIELDSHTDAYEYLLKVAEACNMELSFHVDHNGYRVTGRYVNLQAQRGSFRGYEVIFGKNLVSVERRRTYADIITALIGVGPTPSGGGAPLEYTAHDETALARWGRNGRHLYGFFTPDTDAQDLTYEGLRDATIRELRNRVGHQSDYIVTLHTLSEVIGVDPSELRFGDIVQVKDEEFNPPLRIAARIHTMSESIKHYGDSEVILSAFDDRDYGEDGAYQDSF